VKRKIGQMGIFAQAKVGRWEKIGSVGLGNPREEGKRVKRREKEASKHERIRWAA
jgi:hypothetical protein